jgi:hypothetical protein
MIETELQIANTNEEMGDRVRSSVRPLISVRSSSRDSY